MMQSKIAGSSDCLSPSAAVSATKNITTIGIVKLLLLLATCFGASLLIVRQSQTKQSQTKLTLLNQIDELDRELAALESLKKNHNEDETELRWDKQQIQELEKQIQELKSGFETTTHFFLKTKERLTKENNALLEGLASSSGANDDGSDNSEGGEERVFQVDELSEQISKTRHEVMEEQRENMALREILSEMRIVMENHHKGLRGGNQYRPMSIM